MSGLPHQGSARNTDGAFGRFSPDHRRYTRARRHYRGNRFLDAVARRRIVDAGGCVVTPGLINTHHHLFQSVMKAAPQGWRIARDMATGGALPILGQD